MKYLLPVIAAFIIPLYFAAFPRLSFGDEPGYVISIQMENNFFGGGGGPAFFPKIQQLTWLQGSARTL